MFPQGKRYFVLIEEIRGKPMKAGESFRAAHIVGYFDDIDEMNEVYAESRGHTALALMSRAGDL